jgi:glycosyltransferase involved in cell wall biosynthesis
MTLTPEHTTAASADQFMPAQNETAPLISLVVATLERTDELRVMLNALAGQTERRFEVLAVDQNPDDRLVPIIEEARAGGLVIRHLRRSTPGVCAARNAGLAAARAPIVAFPDDDCWYECDAVAGALAHFADNPVTAGLVGHWVEHDPQRRRPGAPLDPRCWRLYKGDAAAAFTLFFRTGMLRAVGGFSEYLGPANYFGCGEEEDLILRLLEMGTRIDYVPTVHIHHYHNDAPALSDALRRRSRHYGRGTGAVLAKHKFPLWIVARGLVGPLYRALRAPNKASALILSWYTVLGRIEGLVSWWLRGAGAKKAP